MTYFRNGKNGPRGGPRPGGEHLSLLTTRTELSPLHLVAPHHLHMLSKPILMSGVMGSVEGSHALYYGTFIYRVSQLQAPE